MSVFSSIATPGSVPGLNGGSPISPDRLFRDAEERESYRRMLEGGSFPKPEGIKVKCVKVRIFDLSDKTQVEEYEKLWKSLLEKMSRMEVCVDHHKDLVRREDGTSYWMKYVEYVEFDDSKGNDKDQKKARRELDERYENA